MKIAIILNYEKLEVVNNLMSVLDTIKLEEQSRHLKSTVAICKELREKLLHKAISKRGASKSFKIELKYYFADALYRYLEDFSIYWDTPSGSFEENVFLMLRNDLHQKLL
ncbi:hypothetical protein ACXA18_10230 [Riemerella anatipestifer]